MRARGLAARLDPWAPPLLLMGLIFFLSSRPDLSSGLGVFDLVGRKLIHATEYGLLCWLWWRALRTRMTHPTSLGVAALISIAYAATDEYHQTFIAGRHGTPVDVLIDSVGVLVAIAMIARTRREISR